MTAIEPLAQPRVDTLVSAAPEGEQRRRTDIGTVWIDGCAELAGLMLRRVGQPGIVTPGKEVAFFVPDSLPYRRETLADAQLSVSVALAAGGEQSAIVAADAAFVDDPRARRPGYSCRSPRIRAGRSRSLAGGGAHGADAVA